MKWWSKCISMVIAKTASRSVAFKAARLADSTFDRQSEILRTEAAQVNSPSHEEDLDNVGCNADLYVYTLLDRTRFRARVDVVTSDHNHNNRVIPIVFSRLVLTKS